MRTVHNVKVGWLRGVSSGRYTDFWVTSNVFLARLHRSPLVTVAGHQGRLPGRRVLPLPLL